MFKEYEDYDKNVKNFEFYSKKLNITQIGLNLILRIHYYILNQINCEIN
jgi:hypothetical protein